MFKNQHREGEGNIHHGWTFINKKVTVCKVKNDKVFTVQVAQFIERYTACHVPGVQVSYRYKYLFANMPPQN